jgi:DNA-binding MarR family transcriptional regulator
MTRPDATPSPITPAVEVGIDCLVKTWIPVHGDYPAGVSGPQLQALLAVDGQAGVTVNELAGMLDTVASSASRLCDRLQAAGLLDRGESRDDRRKVVLVLTRQGHDVLAQIRKHRHQDLSRMLAMMTPAGKAALLRGLTDLSAVHGGAVRAGGAMGECGTGTAG